MSLSLEKQLAVSILEGDDAAARALVDRLLETWNEGIRRLPPIHRIPVQVDRLRVVIYFNPNPDIRISKESVENAIRKWLRGEGQGLYLIGAERIELYEFPPQEKKPVVGEPR